MTTRLLELLFRRKALLALPIVVGLLMGVAWLVLLKPKPVYFAQASVWVDRPSAITGVTTGRSVLLADVTDFNQYTSPANNQTSALQELLASKSFVTAVLAELGEVDPSVERIQEVRSKTSVWAAGSHLVFVQYRATDARASAATVKAVLDQFTINFSTQLKAKANQASTYYQAQLVVARDGLNEANNVLQAYVRAHPKVLQSTSSSSPTTPVDPDYVKLSLNLDAAKATYDKVLSDYGQSVVIANTADGGTAYFYVVDQPELPTRPLHLSKKTMIMELGAGLFVGVLGSVALLLLMWKADRKVRVPADVEHFGVEVIGLPTLRLKRHRDWPTAYLRMAGALQAGFGGLRPRS